MTIKMFSLTGIVIYIFVISFSTSAATVVKRFPDNRNGDKLTNMVVKDDRLYATENGLLHVLDADLQPIQSFNTCVGDNCDNVNKVLTVFGDMLIMCGTGNNGVCQAWNGSTVKHSSSSDVSKYNYLTVSSDINKPAVGLVHNGDLYIGVTKGLDEGKREIGNKTYNYFISRTHIETGFSEVASVYFLDEDYPVYFRKAFQTGSFIYFLTNQRNNLSSSNFVTKLISICVDESYQSKEIKSYTDIVLSCEVDGVEYNLLQDAEFLPANGILVAAFSKGVDPENPTTDSAVCVYTMDAVNDAILRANEDFFTCSSRDSMDTTWAYLEINVTQCQTKDQLEPFKEGYFCRSQTDNLGPGSNVIGNISPLQPNSTYIVENYRITKVKGIDRYGLYPDVLIGTDKGSIIKLTLDKSLKILMYQQNTVIDQGHIVTDLYIGENIYYVVTNRKITLSTKTECTQFTTCKDTIEQKNPSCGWCITESKISKKTNCLLGWLSSHSECVSIDASPKYVPITEIAKTPVTITVKHVPENVPTTGMRCKYLIGINQIGGLTTALKSGNTYTCNIRSKMEHVELRLQLWAFNKSLLFSYAETTIQIYDCNSYTSCGQCLVSPEVNCVWCPTSLTCQNSALSCDMQVNDKKACPRLVNTSDIYLPNGVNQEIIIKAADLVTDNKVTYQCVVKKNEFNVTGQAVIINGNFTCSLNVSYDNNTAKEVLPLSVFQKSGSNEVEIENSIEVTVYKCEHLASDCTRCCALNTSRYDCKWNSSDQCIHSSQRCSANNTCPLPQITAVYPPSGGYKGGTQLTITGTDFGTNATNITDVMVGDLKCKDIKVNNTSNLDFITINKEIKCTLDRNASNSRIGLRNVTFKLGTAQAGNGRYYFKNPIVTKIEPTFGPLIGGTPITLSGTDLDIENKTPIIRLGALTPSNDVTFVYPNLTCFTPEVTRINTAAQVQLTWDGENYISTDILFKFLPAPNITEVSSVKATVSGGTRWNSTGTHLNNTVKAYIIVEYADDNTKDTCFAYSQSSLECQSPPAPDAVVKEMNENIGHANRRRKRSTVDDSITVHITIKMDGYEKTLPMEYFRDPELYMFRETTPVFKSDDRRLTIVGNYLNLVGGTGDYIVSIGLGNCYVIEVTRTNITCIPPRDSPNKTAEELGVVVQLGYFKQSVGYVRYEIVTVDTTVQNVIVIVLPIVGGLLLIGIIAGAIGSFKYRRIQIKAKKFEQNLADMELKIKKVFREEFLDMHTTMSRVNESLIEKGFPYNNYQRYSFLMLFPGEWHMDEHPLMHEPVVPAGIRSNIKKGMKTFEQLLLNKFFLLSIISTMEKQRKFFLKERANMAGYLSVALLGRMDYFHEILTVLVTTLVDETPTKQQKTLFRRYESITEKLLSNWLSLSLYLHVKFHSGSPLYMLLKGTQLTMESGPIDAITGDSKYTLSEEKLLRQDDQHTSLTLSIWVDNSDEVRDCKVLDCDTISQVKAKCLDQTYVNHPASQLTVDSSELDLEWHWGSGGRLVIKDEDTISTRDGEWLRLNTLEHYRVTDGSSMSLLDPHGMLCQEDYVNMAQIKIDTDGADTSVPSKEPDVEIGADLTRWHLVKSDDGQRTGFSVTDELYLNRLITTKQSILEYMENMFDTILNNTVPPPVKFLFDFLDEAGERNKVDADTLHAWKSQCYAVRYWATLINKPYNLFDQKIPSYVETSMEVISKVLIESCSLKGHQYTKESSPGKLIFKNDMVKYRGKVKEYYTQVKGNPQTSEDLRQCLKDLNKFQQQQTHFNRHTALYSLYLQLKPYMDEILEDLENNEDTKALHLDKKLEELNSAMKDNVVQDELVRFVQA